MKQADILDRVRAAATKTMVEIDRVTDEEIRADALACSLARVDEAWDPVVGRYAPPTPEGGVYGWDISVYRRSMFQLHDDDCDDDCALCDPQGESVGRAASRWPVPFAGDRLLYPMHTSSISEGFRAVYLRG